MTKMECARCGGTEALRCELYMLRAGQSDSFKLLCSVCAEPIYREDYLVRWQKVDEWHNESVRMWEERLKLSREKAEEAQHYAKWCNERKDEALELARKATKHSEQMLREWQAEKDAADWWKGE